MDSAAAAAAAVPVVVVVAAVAPLPCVESEVVRRRCCGGTSPALHRSLKSVDHSSKRCDCRCRSAAAAGDNVVVVGGGWSEDGTRSGPVCSLQPAVAGTADHLVDVVVAGTRALLPRAEEEALSKGRKSLTGFLPQGSRRPHYHYKLLLLLVRGVAAAERRLAAVEVQRLLAVPEDDDAPAVVFGTATDSECTKIGRDNNTNITERSRSQC